MSKKVASLEKISKTYGKDDLTVKALDSINLEIYKGGEYLIDTDYLDVTMITFFSILASFITITLFSV